jgi:UDP-glucose 4-epimerase
MRILIIGAGGFIGRHLWDALNQARKVQVWAADILPPTHFGAENYAQISPTNPDFEQLLRDKNYDVCVNCSGAAQVAASFQNPLLDYQLNTQNVYKILDTIRQYSPETAFLNLSSAAVYGDPTSIPTREDSPLRPLSPYGFNKRMAEEVCQQFSQCFGLKTCSVRIFSAYGEGLRKQLFWDVYQKMRANPDQIELFGTGEESRDFIYVKDLVQVLDLIINHAYYNQPPLNVANGQEISVREAVRIFADLVGYNGEQVFTGNAQTGYPTRWQADIQTIQDLGYAPEYSLAQGLKKYADWVLSL